MSSAAGIRVQTLEKHFELFERSADCNIILGKLRMCGMISPLDMQRLQAEKTQMERNRKCLDIILRDARVIDHFEKFCWILNSYPCYNSLVESLIASFVIYSNEAEIREYIRIDAVLLYLDDLFTANEKAALDSSADGHNKRNGLSREDYFITILNKRDTKFVKRFIEYLTLDSENLKELYLLLQSLIESFTETINDPSSLTNAISMSPGMLDYREHLKQFYLQHNKSVAEDNFQGPNINQYINLSLTVPKNDEAVGYAYFQTITDPYSLLFKHKENNCSTILKSLPEIFDFSGGRQVILIQGSPGSGKTTLANEICRQWARGTLVQNFTHVIMLKLRDPRIINMSTIDEVIHCNTGNAGLVYEAVRDIHSCHGMNVLLLLEGWDELHEEKQHKSFFADIVIGKVLKDASVLITSRPSSIGTIQKILVTHNIAILGFSEDQIKQYLQHCLEGSIRRRFLTELDNHPALKSLACIPVNLSILVHVFKQCGKKLPSSWTDLYQNYVLLKLSHYCLRMDDAKIIFEDLDELPPYIKDNLKALSEAAFYELGKDSFTINEDQMQQYYSRVIPGDFDGMGLLQVENHIMQKSNYRTFSFLHRTVQEFAAAWYLSQLHRGDQTMLLIDILENKATNYEMVLVFYGGLTGLKAVDLEAVLSPVIKRELLSKFAVNFLSWDFKLILKSSTAAKNFRISSIAEEYYSMVTSNTLSCEILLVLITCCAEAQNPAACRTLCSSDLFYSDACYIKIPDSALTSQVLSSLSYCIVNSGKKWRVDCPHLCITDILCLHKHFETNKICGELTALHTYTGKHQIEHFMMLIQSQCQLRCLDLSGSRSFDDHCVNILAEMLTCNECLIILQLTNCRISSKGLLALSKMLQTNNVLEWINLEKNSFSSDDLKIAIQEITTNTSLLLMEVDGSLIDSDIKALLERHNEGREKALRLHTWELVKGYNVVDWGIKTFDKAKAWFKDNF